MAMTTIDFTPLFRSTIGFERMQRLFDAATHTDESVSSYPPYNIEALGEDAYRLSMAVAGFSTDDLDITVKEDTLSISGKAAKNNAENAYLHRGIAGRSFDRRFALAEHIKVTGANLLNGLLHIDLTRDVPEEKKPRKIEIGGDKAKTIESKAA
jgi:molecular chaperone IbpA